ncbi:hypothetical protein FOVG_18046 [Fusarium oxysporum f. sp. pisi HDV247]|uniref:Pisatin demethylase n=1 Tax=Fusarium oxysporum f. sp. pisi HDV247 TaxID=1080344 RepID=W9NS13_FUSOX|nr:hypothetical protein FOVG_18046 [Fusarium oxysporum f. sp. pisi HDV247]
MLTKTILLELENLYINHGLPLLIMVFVFGPIIYFTSWALYTLFLSSLRNVPGPFLARLTRLWEVRNVTTGNIHNIMVNLHKKHGPIVRVAPNRYDFDTPQALKIIYRIGNAFHKSHFYDPFGSPHFKNLINELDNERHAAMRRQIASLYTMSALLSFESAVDGLTLVLKKKLQDFSNKEDLIDLPQFLQYYAFDVITAISVGEPMGMMESNKDIGDACKGLDDIWHNVAVMGLLPGLYPWMVRIVNLLGLRGLTDGLDTFVDLHMRQYPQKEKSQGNETITNSTFMDTLLELQRNGKITDKEIRLCLFMNISAGSDTTGISLSCIIYYLYTNPDTLRQLRVELRDAAKKGILSDSFAFKETQGMPYLQAVIKEALRLHPAVGTQLTRIVPKGGIVIENQHFPEGVEVGVNAWALYHNEHAFGNDASEFRPERWLESGGDRNDGLRIAGSFAFGAGPRSCIGKNISILEMSKAIPQIVQNFDFDIVPQGHWENECWWFVKPSYKVRVRRSAV